MQAWLRNLWVVCAAMVAYSGWAQTIYTCVDAKGRRLTSDRPIADCTDREQKELNPSGSVKRRVGPTLTAKEQLAQEEQARIAAQEQARLNDQKRRDRALLTRYPNKASHDQERTLALTQIDELVASARKRLVELAQQRKTYEAELEFYKGDVSKAPALLRRQFEDNDLNAAAQQRFILEQADEKKRVNQRFDEELVKLRQLWTMLAIPAGITDPTTPKK